MKALALVSLASVSLAACSVSEGEFREACERTAQVTIADPLSWNAYIAQLRLERQRWYGEDTKPILGATADYEAYHQRFESGRKLIEDEISQDEMHVRDRSTGKSIGVITTVEILRPYFGYSESENCIWTHPEFYQRWLGSP